MSLRARLVLAMALLLLGGGGYTLSHLEKQLDFRYRESVEENLVDQANLLAAMLGNGLDTGMLGNSLRELQSRDLHATIYGFTKTRTRLQVYVTDLQGKVLYHSLDPQSLGADYSQWRDVYLTLHGKYGARSTRSDPNNEQSSVLYVAAGIHDNLGKLQGVVTVGKPVQDFLFFVESARTNMRVWFGIAGIALLLGVVLASTWVLRPFHALRARLQAKAYIENYLQDMTHELKSPISSIAGAAEILQGNPAPAQAKRFLENIRSETRRMQEIVQSLLELSALERQSHVAKHEPLDIPAINDSLRESLEPIAEREHVALVLYAPENSCIVTGDTFLLRQALHNLLLNAVEHAPANSQVTLRWWNEPKSGFLGGAVEDQGPGIPDYATKRIFDRFYSLPKPRTGRKGTGLGLPFAREVMRLHGGTLQLNNRTQGGTVAAWTIRI